MGSIALEVSRGPYSGGRLAMNSRTEDGVQAMARLPNLIGAGNFRSDINR